MNGPEHYRAAEADLARAEQSAYPDRRLASAQVHATLALAATQADALQGPGVNLRESAQVWQEVVR